jgi:hypothetical protein
MNGMQKPYYYDMVIDLLSRRIGPKKSKVQLKHHENVMYLITFFLRNELLTEEDLIEVKNCLREIGIILPKIRTEILYKLVDYLYYVLHQEERFEFREELLSAYKQFSMKFDCPSDIVELSYRNVVEALKSDNAILFPNS